MHSVFWLGKYAQIRLYIEYLIYIHILILWIKVCQFFRNCVCNATHNDSFGLWLTAINEVHRRVYYIIDDIFVFFYRSLSDLCIESLTGYENMTQLVNYPGYGSYPGYGKFPGYWRPGIKTCINPCRKSRIWKLSRILRLSSKRKLNIIQYSTSYNHW